MTNAKKMHRNMNAFQKVEVVSSTAKVADTCKYNLRCNRNVSEKMMKKDFIYDIPTSMQTVKKLEVQKRPFILQLQLKRKPNVGSKTSTYTVVPEKAAHDGSGDAVVAGRRDLEYKCNFCQEPIATLFSLSTHVKFHCKPYCKICYWILRENETMEQHTGSYHQRLGQNLTKF
ncbi:uncharacterized protein LOC109863980 [Pseudomyrmex gracilis]|uniref:uncharacterized protein LOC109863980 n=1 Tax=Pseudomyrmex gracilis TaxID=219809 RepID=UPI000994E11D|nr:uncharacterized protein LOC109863980 [Pseudomyrmex gracilis]